MHVDAYDMQEFYKICKITQHTRAASGYLVRGIRIEA